MATPPPLLTPCRSPSPAGGRLKLTKPSAPNSATSQALGHAQQAAHPVHSEFQGTSPLSGVSPAPQTREMTCQHRPQSLNEALSYESMDLRGTGTYLSYSPLHTAPGTQRTIDWMKTSNKTLFALRLLNHDFLLSPSICKPRSFSPY